MTPRIDILFLGGGLANGLAAHRLAIVRPRVSTLVLEAGTVLGGNHTWSFHQGDLAPGQLSWIDPFISARWAGTDVHFPGLRRTLTGGYFSIRSERFHEVLSESLAGRFRLNAPVASAVARRVTLASGEVIEAGCVVDGRGWTSPPGVAVAWQKFTGIDLQLSAPHGLTRPVIMDATVEQDGDFRFFYLLPWDETRLLVEDTRYSDTHETDESAARAAINAYVDARGWRVERELRVETAALPIPLGGMPDFYAPGTAISGLRGGFFHATTGYSLPGAVRFADDFLKLPAFKAPVIAAWSRERARMHWKSQAFFRALNRLLFLAAKPDERRNVLESFYRRGDALISRFYSGQLGTWDHIRLLSGKPPVPISSALKALRRF